MLSRARCETLLDDLIKEGVLEDAHRLSRQRLGDVWGKEYSLVAGLEGVWQVGATRARIGVGLSEDFPDELPHVFLLSHGEPELIPHVEENYRVCCFEGEGLLLDRRRPARVLRETLERARRTIKDGLAGTNRLDIFNECEAYWGSKTRLLCNVTPDDVARDVMVFSGRIRGVADNRRALEEASYKYRGQPLSEQKGIYVPLEQTIFSANFHPLDIESGEALRQLIREHVSLQNQERLKRAARTRGSSVFVILGIPKPIGGRALLGLWLRQATSRRPLLEGKADGNVDRVHLERSDRDVLQARSAPASTLKGSHVIIVGCGSLGGHVAMCLAWAGIGRLTLVDPDRFQPANIFRHVLGRSGVLTESKVAGLKQEIELKIPELNVFAVNSKIGAALKEDRVKLDGSSLIVVAIGNPTASLALNDTLLSLSGAPPVVFTWLEPYGLGGHALLTNTRIPGASGCFQCLLRDDPELGLVNTADFAAPRQVFGRPDLGCSGAFVPYGDLDARETANLATRLIIDALRGRVPGHVLRSWRGDATDFRNAGFQTSPRYDLENVDKGGHGYCHDDCRFCKGRPA